VETSSLRPALPFLSTIYAGLLLSAFSPANSQDKQPLTQDDFNLLHSTVQPDASPPFLTLSDSFNDALRRSTSKANSEQ
jgi:hypothetical protein